MTYDELPDHPGPGVVLYCATCNQGYSATAGDYFMCEGTNEIECGECGDPLSLARKCVTMDPIEASEAES